MLALILAVVLVLGASSLLGSVVWRVAVGTPSPAAMPVGFVLLMGIVTISTRLPGGTSASAVVCASALVTCAWHLRRGRTWMVPRWTLLTAAVVVMLAMIPFGASGRVGVLGVGTNDDMGEHLLAAWALQGHLPLSASKLISSGYPIGPHAVAAVVAGATGMSLERAFMGLIVAVPALLALAAIALLPGRSRAMRSAAGALVGLCYLQSAYLAQASFKEPMETMIFVGFIAVLHELERPGSRRATRLVPLALLAVGTVYVSSYLGLLWPAGALLVWSAFHIALPRRSLRRVLAIGRCWLRPAAIAGAVFLALIGPELARMIRFSHSVYNHEGPAVYGDLLRPMPPLEAVGIWPRLDFRFDIPLGSLGGLLALLALPTLVAALALLVRRRQLAVPAGLIVSTLLYALSTARSPYTAAKGLVIAAPFVTLILASALLIVSHRARWSRSWNSLAAALLATLLVAGTYSDLEVLRDGPVGPSSHLRQLAELKGIVGRNPTVFLGDDDYVHWELRGAQIATVPEPLYVRTVVPLRRAKAQPARSNYRSPGATTTTSRFAGLGLAYDFDSVPVAQLDRFIYVIAPRSAYSSPAPPNWRLVRLTASYELWRRLGPTLPYQTLHAIDNPGAILNCATSFGRAVANRRGVAMVQPAPVVGERTFWKGAVGYAGRSAHQILRLASGSWDISLQYDSTVGVTVRGPGMRAALPANLEPLGAYWYVGRVHVAHPTWARIIVTSHPLPLLGRLLGSFGLTRAPAPTGIRPLGRLTATRPPSSDRLIPLKKACGRYVDWYRVS